jgi:hypothetical protein
MGQKWKDGFALKVQRERDVVAYQLRAQTHDVGETEQQQ